jgi:hypothetical protein
MTSEELWSLVAEQQELYGPYIEEEWPWSEDVGSEIID